MLTVLLYFLDCSFTSSSKALIATGLGPAADLEATLGCTTTLVGRRGPEKQARRWVAAPEEPTVVLMMSARLWLCRNEENSMYLCAECIRNLVWAAIRMKG